MIRDYSELIAEAASRSGVSDIANRAGMFVGMAEKMLSKRLRLAKMEKTVELTTRKDGLADLPTDYQEMRVIRAGGRELPRVPLAQALAARRGYAIKGRMLITSPRRSRVCQLVYYAAVPKLETNNTSWLLEDEPELYLQAALFQVYTANNDIEKAQATAGYLGGLIDAANEADRMQRHAGTRINFVNVAP